jgi:hypothetical protein
MRGLTVSSSITVLAQRPVSLWFRARETRFVSSHIEFTIHRNSGLVRVCSLPPKQRSYGEMRLENQQIGCTCHEA